MTVVYEKLIGEIESLLQLYIANQRILTNTTQPSNLHGVMEAMSTLRRSRDIVTAANVINKVNQSLIYNVLYMTFYYLMFLFFIRL